MGYNMSKFQISDSAHLTTLDNQLKDALFIGGSQPNAEDAMVFEQFVSANTEPNPETHVNLWSWYALVILFNAQIRDAWKQQASAPAKGGKQEKPAAKKEEAPKAKKDDDDDMDLFGDDDEDDAKALEELKKKKEDTTAKKKGPPPGKSLVVFDIKVWETEQDLDALAKRVLEIEKEGLFWKTEYKLTEVAFGVKKLTIGMTIHDDKISVDDIIDEIQGWEDDVQSVDIVCFNK